MRRGPTGSGYIDTIKTARIDAQMAGHDWDRCLGDNYAEIEFKVVLDPRDVPEVMDAIFEERIALTVEKRTRGTRR